MRNDAAFDPTQLIALGASHEGAQLILQGLVGNMVATGADQLAAARSAWEDGRRGEAARAIHTLRGTYGTLGAELFAASALELEVAIDAAREERVAVLFEASERALALAVELASLWLARGQPRSGCLPGGAMP